ncbi:MAG TPA: thioredoxin domain-containing protein [Chitinophagales bacterium]|nr:thioredoxin domain-containing protein [Chitinophagales bacterium]
MNIKFLSFFFAVILISVSCNSQNAGQVLKPAEFNQKINTTADAVILDVRTPEEFTGGFIANAVNIDYNGSDFNGEIAKLDKNKNYFVYCLSGKRSASAAAYMRSVGFKNVINLDGGILAWQSNNLPLTTTSTPAEDKISFEAYTQMITSDTMVLVDYFAPWCAPCIKMKPMLEEISKEYAGKVKVIRLDINENKELAKKLNIVEIPILKIFKQGKETWMHQGYIEKADLIKQF